MALIRCMGLLLLAMLLGRAAGAGVLGKADLEQMFAPGLIVGEPNAGLPAWPLFEREGPQLALRGYVFESIDFEPVRGYSGKPINLLVAIDQAGKFLDVRMLAHHEPFFTSAAGTALLSAFADQYRGLSIHHSVEIFGHKARTSRDETSAKLHGVAAGTVTVKAMDASIMESAMSVARAHLAAVENGGAAGSSARPGHAVKSARRSERHMRP